MSAETLPTWTGKDIGRTPYAGLADSLLTPLVWEKVPGGQSREKVEDAGLEDWSSAWTSQVLAALKRLQEAGNRVPPRTYRRKVALSTPLVPVILTLDFLASRINFQLSSCGDLLQWLQETNTFGKSMGHL